MPLRLTNKLIPILALLVAASSLIYTSRVQTSCEPVAIPDIPITDPPQPAATEPPQATEPPTTTTQAVVETQTQTQQPQQQQQSSPPLAWHESNSLKVQEWRSALQDALDRNDTETYDKLRQSPFVSQPIFPCKRTFLDFGSNVGDSLRKFIDAGLPRLPNDKHPLLDLSTGKVGEECYDCKRRTKHKWILGRHLETRLERGTHPEDYCFYGVEGNPHFTERLQRTAATVLHMDPRPVRHVHFLTGHIGAGRDGPTTLFLDTVNAKDNFWGSSVYQSHRDIVESGNNTGVNVTGITLTTLLPQTVLPGGYVIIKVDIEGGEYALMEEALESDIFCQMRRKLGVTIHIILEPHYEKVVGSTEPSEHWKEINGNTRIRRCGVHLKVGDAGR